MPDLAAYNALPILQVFAGAAVLLGSIWMMIQAQRDKQKLPPPAPMPEGAQMFFNGPLVQALQCLRDIANILGRVEEHNKLVRDELREQTEKQTAMMSQQIQEHARLMHALHTEIAGLRAERRRDH